MTSYMIVQSMKSNNSPQDCQILLHGCMPYKGGLAMTAKNQPIKELCMERWDFQFDGIYHGFLIH